MTNIQSITTGLKLGENGIWHSSETEKTSYPTDGNDAFFAIEDNSFWFKHRNNCIAALVTNHPPEKNETIFDIGGGNGFVASRLAQEGFKVALVEPGVTGCLHAKSRGIQLVIHATAETAGFKPQSLPAVGLFDVIEHIEDDLNFLKSIKQLLKKGGYLYTTVPAYSFLWSAEDNAAGHCKRYNLQEFSQLLKTAGFQIEFTSYIFRPLPIPIFLQRALPYRLGTSSQGAKNKSTTRDHNINNKIIERILNALFKSETTNLKKKKSMLFGSSCVVVAKRI